MATKKEHRLSVRFDAERLTWLGKVAKASDRDASWVVRYCVDEMRASGRLPTSKSEVLGLARKAGGA